MSSIVFWAGVIGAWLVGSSYSQTLDPIEDMCARWDHQSVVKNNVLYIDGGVETFDYNGGRILGYNQWLIRVDMSDSWDWKTNISDRRIEKTQNSGTGTYPPSLARGALFQGPQNDTKIYTYGGTAVMANQSFPGWVQPEVETYTLWSYDTSGQNWQQYDVTSGSPRRPNYGAHAEAPALGLAFFLNGQLDQGSSIVTKDWWKNTTEYLDGLIIVDTVQQTTRNASTKSLGSPRVGGGLQYIENISSNGILVALGGMRSAGARTENSTNGVLIDFTTVGITDDFVGNGDVTWYNQTTTGDIPPARVDFCITAVSASDNSSYNIYLYGGYDPINSTMYDDIYVLSLPSFTWTKLFGPGESARYGHTCHLVGKRQMLTVGGSLDAKAYAIETTAAPLNLSSLQCDWEEKGVAIYDMSTLEWGSVFNAYKVAYQVPQKLFAVIGGTGDGKATMTAPANGFAQAAISTMFNPPPTTSAASSTASNSASNETNTGAIAGGVVGGVAGLALIVGAVFWALRSKKRQKRHDPNAPEMDHEATRQEMESALPPRELLVDERPSEVGAHKEPVEMDAYSKPTEMDAAHEHPVELPGDQR
ncbi:uncharacterized protein K452DRAFT_283752 [Aplosporella prunicola CBS 121167]|uniref:Uncharacterized protein n=1 Tax=Aplosporella prunicola CBS 121167 TaxID=1176127 RepID=A0A6A6BMN9_9PEZI|nr:uncharacterized protein K452DRAFT_283752 [Aplosporella prunicola CBS 121167]KAF2145392.1 hypothetical protein K452DRAFT_283752 [Aplosporella prunicola CBS 121167]